MAKNSFNINIFISYTLICILLYTLIHASIYEPFQTDSKNIELVIARYKENLDWLDSYDDGIFNSIVIYNKSSEKLIYTSKNAKSKVIDIPNVGVCDHTYLYHIVNNYDNLADITVFVPGSGNIPYKKELINFTIQTIQKTNDTVLPVYEFDDTVGEAMYNLTIDQYTLASDENREAHVDYHYPASIRPFGKWYESHFPGSSMKKSTFTGVFSASKEDIRSRDKEFYKTMLNQVNSEKFHEASHYIERAWTSIFKSVKESSLYYSPVHENRIGVNQDGCKYLRRSKLK